MAGDAEDLQITVEARPAIDTTGPAFFQAPFLLFDDQLQETCWTDSEDRDGNSDECALDCRALFEG